MLHPEIKAIQRSVTYQDKAKYLCRRASGFDPQVLPAHDTRDERITLLPGLALVRTAIHPRPEVDGQAVTSMTQDTDTCVRGEPGWVCMKAKLTPVVDESPLPPDSTIVCQ